MEHILFFRTAEYITVLFFLQMSTQSQSKSHS